MIMNFVIGLLAGTAVVAVLAFIRSGFRVENGNVAVLAVFGRFLRDRQGAVITFGPGLHWRRPWAHAIEVSLAERSLSLGGTSDKPAAVEALAADGTRIRVNARLRFRVAPDRVDVFLADSKDAVEELAGLFRLTMHEQIARFEIQPGELSAYTALRLRMSELQQRTREAIAEVALADYGIQVTSVDLLQIDPPEELVDALNAVITADTEANALVSRTELIAQQRVLAAKQAVEIANAHALANEAEIRTVGAELTTLADQGVLRDYVARRRDEVLGGSQRVYLNHQSTTPFSRS
jgi:regulator of protease activity HflC (stomatin/prohibitin superfamily)